MERLRIVSEAMKGLKESKQALGAEVIAGLEEFQPPTIFARASRLHFSTRVYNLLVTNVPGPQFPLYLLGRELDELIPVAFLAPNQTLAVAIMSYNGKVNVSLIGDYDAMPDLDELAEHVSDCVAELRAAAESTKNGRSDHLEGEITWPTSRTRTRSTSSSASCSRTWRRTTSWRPSSARRTRSSSTSTATRTRTITVRLQEGEDGQVDCGETTMEPEVVMSMEADTAHKFWLGKVNVTVALARGQMKAKGPVAKILKLVPLVKPVFPRYRKMLEEAGRQDLMEAA